MDIDRRRFVRAARNAEKTRPKAVPVGAATTGASAAVRANLDLIRRLRNDGVRWAAIAQALTDQGVHRLVDGEPHPLTASRVTAIVRSIERQEAKTKTITSLRAGRSDLARPAPADPLPRSVGLAPELQAAGKAARDTASGEGLETEEALRQRRLDEVRRRYTKDPDA